MKKYILPVLITLSCYVPFVGFAQTTIKEEMKSMPAGTNNSFSIQFGGVKKKLIEKEWEIFVKEYKGKSKKDKKTGMFFTDNASIVAFGGANTVDLYALTEETLDSAKFTLWIDLGGSYLNSKDHVDKMNDVNFFLNRFSVKVRRSATELLLEEEDKKLKKLETNIEKLLEDNEKQRSEIDKARKIIRDSEGRISKNEQEVESNKKVISTQMELLSAIRKKLEEIR